MWSGGVDEGVEPRDGVGVGRVRPERLERLADSALYTAKRSGRDRVEVAVKELDDDLIDTASLEDEISR